MSFAKSISTGVLTAVLSLEWHESVSLSADGAGEGGTDPRPRSARILSKSSTVLMIMGDVGDVGT